MLLRWNYTRFCVDRALYLPFAWHDMLDGLVDLTVIQLSIVDVDGLT